MSVASQPGRPGNRLPVAARSRRPTLIVLAVLLVLIGALGSALLAYRSGNRTDVLVAAGDITPGHRMAAGDFAVARVAVDTGAVVSSAARETVIGSYAVERIPAGTLVNRAMFRSGGIIPDDSAVVGLNLAVSQRPADPPEVGDVVRIFLAPTSSQGSGGSDTSGTGSGTGSTGSSAATGQTIIDSARVTEVEAGASSGSTLSLSVLVRASDAAVLVPLAAQNQLGVATLASNTQPPVDFAS